MTRAEALRQTRQEHALIDLGFTFTEAVALRRISITLHRWAEHECNGTIQRDGDNGDGRPFWYYETRDGRHVKGSPVPDRERGALKRLQAIVDKRNDRALDGIARTDAAVIRLAVTYYVQGDPRGAALYILRPGDIPEGQDAGSHYNRGIVVY